VNALADSEVGKYLNTHFVSSFQKVGTFRIDCGRKQGGNVASYFCTPDGRVLHVVAGAVNAAVLLREARWVVETWKLAQLEKQDRGPGLKAVFGKAHAERLRREHDLLSPRLLPTAEDPPTAVLIGLLKRPAYQALSPPGLIHMLLAAAPLMPIERLYQVIFEQILGETITTSPVEWEQSP
jgi:hypothetical protein